MVPYLVSTRRQRVRARHGPVLGKNALQTTRSARQERQRLRQELHELQLRQRQRVKEGGEGEQERER